LEPTSVKREVVAADFSINARHARSERQDKLPTLYLVPTLFPVAAHFCVMSVVAKLAQGRKVQKARGLRPVVENMRRSQNHFTSSDWVRFAVFRATPFAAVSRADKANEPAAKRPINRVAMFVLWANRHYL
jgi:hypothetical protein